MCDGMGRNGQWRCLGMLRWVRKKNIDDQCMNACIKHMHLRLHAASGDTISVLHYLQGMGSMHKYSMYKWTEYMSTCLFRALGTWKLGMPDKTPCRGWLARDRGGEGA